MSKQLVLVTTVVASATQPNAFEATIALSQKAKMQCPPCREARVKFLAVSCYWWQATRATRQAKTGYTYPYGLWSPPPPPPVVTGTSLALGAILHFKNLMVCYYGHLSPGASDENSSANCYLIDPLPLLKPSSITVYYICLHLSNHPILSFHDIYLIKTKSLLILLTTLSLNV